MSSINNIDVIDQVVLSLSKPLLKDVIDQHQVAYELEQKDVFNVLSALKLKGWKQLSYLSAVDWPNEVKFEVVYILMNWEQPSYVQIRTKIDRNQPVMPSVLAIFPGAKYYEREAHEFFGIHFPGNPEYEKPLILERWDDIPPLRKDFDPSAYSAKKFPSRTYPDSFSVKDENNKILEKKAEKRKRAQNLRTGGESS
ncbi:MAG: hypothetical protein A2Y45_04410 [Tenericutes bacterium GWC2_34_14]|nr:MAG: hypothetical protein A2Y45_04410 [Tenericutes bacterium GWC2_34_14]OHE33312.1 MAG: hypothetical protein A2012_06190 [Tenericutes bacterium GWE2_34_108]OHE36463.1 MAG: hypothetical protein A2Y46_08295 [Tenericutes bacterium GWF1_35_14]OHE37667.1 MAG: hypothetical protein A2Y44_03220 [Tenericutes bacterium GWF2_35_184]OHE45056.1 MAG: hypothetical protein A2221_02290 [Tenericutes bacterium RIFOXYA2_FULL_36_32]OHE45846.1 MAG: hypothetical protein A3K26_08665 [Tenericutes bacterium RIFOXYA1